MSIEANVRAADELVDLFTYIDDLPEDIRKAIDAKLREKYTVRWKTCEPVGPMDDQEARAFEDTVFPIPGSQLGVLIHEVPNHYLIWITESNQEFLAELRRYLKSDRFARVQA